MVQLLRPDVSHPGPCCFGGAPTRCPHSGVQFGRHPKTHLHGAAALWNGWARVGWHPGDEEGNVLRQQGRRRDSGAPREESPQSDESGNVPYSCIAILLPATTLAFAQGPKTYSDLESFKSRLSVGIVKERILDINNDGQPDILIYSTGGEEIFLDILLKEEDHFVHLKILMAEHYEIVGSLGRYELKIGQGTFPTFGDIHGSDKYLWYDFYEVVGHSLALRNSRHPGFYAGMLSLYQKRIQELEDEILSLEQQKSEPHADIATLELFVRFRRDHIERYQEFIRKASAIIQRRKGT